jgi:hypothetical protein
VAVWSMMERRHPLHIESVSHGNGNETGGSGQEWKVAVWPMMERRHPLHIESVSQGNKSVQRQRDRRILSGV